jgi:hypothetical protein
MRIGRKRIPQKRSLSRNPSRAKGNPSKVRVKVRVNPSKVRVRMIINPLPIWAKILMITKMKTKERMTKAKAKARRPAKQA